MAHDTPVSFAGSRVRQGVEQGVAGVMSVPDDTVSLGHTSPVVYFLEEGKLASYDALSCPHDSLQSLAVEDSTVPIPSGGATRQNTLYGATVESLENTRAHPEGL